LSQAEAATAVGLINSVGSIAGFAGPYIFGYVYTSTGASFSLGLRLVMAAVLIAGLMILRIPKGAARVSATPIVKPAPVRS
jgi:MFS transporter, ACS family, tartrate transporter